MNDNREPASPTSGHHQQQQQPSSLQQQQQHQQLLHQLSPKTVTTSPQHSHPGSVPMMHCNSSSSNSSSGGMLYHESSSDLGHNSLGLLNGFGSSYPTASSIAMQQSHSTPAFSFCHNDASHPFGPRRVSISSASSSSLSVGHASDSLTQQDSYSPRSFTPSESPLGLPSSLSSMSGLAIGTPGTPGNPDLPGYHTMPSPFIPEQHDALLALSNGNDDTGFGMLPPSAKRRAIQSFDASMLPSHDHPLGHPSMHHSSSSRLMDSDGSDETTPMPPSTGTFVGYHPTSNLSDSFKSSSHVPLTPIQTSQRASFSGYTFGSQLTPGQSFSANTTPDYSVRGSSSNPTSPFYPCSVPPRLQRLDSFDSVGSDMPPHNFAEPSPSFYDHKDSKDGILALSALNGSRPDPNVAAFHQLQSPPTFHMHRGSMPDVSVMGSSAMSRVASAPAPPLHRSMSCSQNSPFGSFSSTPSSAVGVLPPHPGFDYRKGIYPTTPGGVLPPSPGYDPYFSAPVMSGARTGMGGLASPISVSPITSLDGRSRSVSGSVTRTTPRSRARNTGPPPLIVSSADKLHVCHCGKRFKRMEHLKRHNRTHTQERPHKCPVETCGKYFGRSDNLAQHLKTHFRPAGLVGRSSELLALTTGSDKFKQNEPRHDPHAAAAAAAAAAAQAAANGKGRSAFTHAALGGPIALNKPQQPRQALGPAGGISANGSPPPLAGSQMMMQHSPAGLW